MSPKVYGAPSPTIKVTDRAKALAELARENSGRGMSGKADYGFIDVPNAIQVNQFHGLSSYLKAGTKLVWCAAKAVDFIGNVVSSTDLSVVPVDSEKQGKRPLRVDPLLAGLLSSPNPFDTFGELVYLWVMHMRFCGRAYWFKDQMDGRGRPRALYPLNPKFIIVVPDRDTRIKKYIYRVNGSELEFAPDEIIDFKRVHADDPLGGLGDIEQGESLYDDHINRTLYRSKFMANGASPSSVLVNEGFDGEQDEFDMMKADFQAQYSGVKNTGKTAWLNGKWTLLQLGLDAQKLQEMEREKLNVEQIFINHGIPLSVAGFGSSNYATARQEDMNFRKYTCKPLLETLVSVLNSPRGFMRAFSDQLKLDFSLEGLLDVEQLMKDYGPLFDRACMTKNELRAVASLPRVDDPLFDAFYMRQGYVPAELVGIVTGDPEPEPEPSPGTVPAGDDDDDDEPREKSRTWRR